MIGSLHGTITWKNDKFALLETGGVGYRVAVSSETLLDLKIGLEVKFFIHTHVREDTFDLYGFLDEKELELFEMLISVSGIGPKSGLVILGIATLLTLQKAIGSGDTAYLTKISGIGKKTAEKIVLELRDKITAEESDGSLGRELDALEALKSLGYSQAEARDALKKVSAADTNAKVREALKILGGK